MLDDAAIDFLEQTPIELLDTGQHPWTPQGIREDHRAHGRRQNVLHQRAPPEERMDDRQPEPRTPMRPSSASSSAGPRPTAKKRQEIAVSQAPRAERGQRHREGEEHKKTALLQEANEEEAFIARRGRTAARRLGRPEEQGAGGRGRDRERVEKARQLGRR